MRFRPAHRFVPADVEELLGILGRRRGETIRAVGSRHAWSAGIHSDDVLISLERFDSVETRTDADGTIWVTAGGGCRIRDLLKKIHAQSAGTMPSLGLIREQTIAGATATGTHGSGKHSLSHYLEEVRVATFDPATGEPAIVTFHSGDELRAARCSFGCLGIVVSVTFRAVPKYFVAEKIQRKQTIDDVLAAERDWPLQQFFLMPHSWQYFAQQRRQVPADQPQRRSLFAWLYRIYWYLLIDIALHLIVKTAVSVFRSRWLTRALYRWILPMTTLRGFTVVDESEKALTMEHQLFRHLEIEIFVPAAELKEALEFLSEMLKTFGSKSHQLPAHQANRIHEIGMADELTRLAGSFTHHYPICVRKVLKDDTLISMATGSAAPYYALSLITYQMPRDAFFGMAEFLARSMTQLFAARLHWGKYFPVDASEVAHTFPELERFREIARKYDPRGTFQSAAVRKMMGFDHVTPADA